MVGGLRRQLQRFFGAERGALLVFFAMCCAAIFLIAALSFDLGKRASTQAELQTYADNVALAAAGELDGMPGAIARATTAANQLIRDSHTFGEGNRDLTGPDDFTLSFYADLPTNETLWTASLDRELPENDRSARFARVEVTPVSVDWSFARILTVFSSAPLPDSNVAAEATAGFSGMACDTTPVFFCMPPAQTGVDTDGVWDPANHIGDTIKLTTASGAASNWGPGSMGFIDIGGAVDTASPCFGAIGPELYNCLSTVATRRTQCIENGALSLQDGEVEDISERYFNVRMDRYLPGVRVLRNNAGFPASPIVTKPFTDSGMCTPSGGDPSTQATDFLPDDCFASGGAGCTSFNGDLRVGDGNWNNARITYVDTNYSVDDLTIGTVEPLEQVNILGNEYHIDDPFRPGDATYPRRAEYEIYPVVPSGASRWNYYNAEVAAAYFEDPAAAYLGNAVDLSGVSSPLRPSPIDLLEVLRPDGTLVPRDATSLPRCSQDTSIDPRRRTFIAAAVDCGTQPLDGTPTARATWFVELFMQSLATGSASDGDMSMYVEVISGGLQNDGGSLTNGTFRNLVQLFR
jgi:hypothetical protein